MIRLDRHEWIQLRKRVENRNQKEKAIVERLLPFLKNAKKIGVYIPIQGEVDVYSKLEMSYDLYVPKVVDDTTMVFCQNKHLQKGKFNVLEPDIQFAIQKEELDVIIVPIVAFDHLHRSGYGKGYYDRYLKDCTALKIGVAFDQQEVQLQVQPWDVDMDYILTETKTIGGKQ